MVGKPYTYPGTRSRTAILEAIASHIEENGWPPSVREIGAAVGLSSSSTVHQHLMQLKREGKIELGGGPRMIRLLNPSGYVCRFVRSGVEQSGSSPAS